MAIFLIGAGVWIAGDLMALIALKERFSQRQLLVVQDGIELIGIGTAIMLGVYLLTGGRL